MKRKQILFPIFCPILFIITSNIIAQTTYTWNKTGIADWTAAVNWTPVRTVPAPNDILLFNNASVTTPVNIPVQTIGQLGVSNNTTVNLQAAAAGTVLTIAGLAAGDDLLVTTGSALNNNGINAGTVFIAAGATANITGNMNFSAAAHRFDAASANAITFNSPAIFTQDIGCSGNVFTTSGTASAIVFNIGTTFLQQDGANPFGLTQPSSKVIFNTGSLFKVKQQLFLSFSGRTYADLEIDFATFNQAVLGVNSLSIDDLTITQGTLSLNLTGGINIKGDITVSAGQALHFNPASANTLSFNGNTLQHISSFGTLSFNNSEAITFNNSSGMMINSNITFNNLVNFTSGIVKVIDPAILTLSATASVAGASNISFVAGMVKKVGSTAFIFPIGSTEGTFSGYVPLKISAPSAITDEYIATYKRSSAIAISSNYATGLDHVSGVDHWIVKRTSGTTAVDVTLYWTVQSSSNGAAHYINNLSKLVIARYNGTTQWDAYGGTFNTGSGFAAGSITWNAVNDFNVPFSLGSTDASNPLPIDTDSLTVPATSNYKGVVMQALMPNPVSNNTILHVISNRKKRIMLLLTDAAGKQVQNFSYEVRKGDNYLSINCDQISTGIYQLTSFSTEEKIQTIRFIKQ